MANRRLLVKRRKAVRNIRKITRTMQLIATARFQAAFTRATATKPYTEKLAELVADLSGAVGNIEHPLMKKPEGVNKSAMVVLTSMRGLCGGYNANVLRLAIAHLDEAAKAGRSTDVHMVGKKGIGYFRFLKREVAERITHIADAPRFDTVEPIANDLMARFTKGELASVHVTYMRFISAGQQSPTTIQLLPIAKEPSGAAEVKRGPRAEYEYSPEPKELLDELLPANVRARLFQCFTDAAVSEQLARMVAMKAATDAAGDMIQALSSKYNRARQTHITMELLDIVGGANAIS